MSLLPPAAMAPQSNLEVIASSKREQRKSGRSAATTTTTTPGVILPTAAAPRPFTAQFLEMVLAKVLDALIFTSALAITAYNYWVGELANTGTPEAAATIKPSSSYYYHGRTIESGGERVLDIRQWRQAHPHQRSSLPPMDRLQERELLEDSKRRRTLLWAESVAKATMATDELMAVTTSISSSSKTSNSSGSSRSHNRQHQRRLRAQSHPITAVATAAAMEDASRDGSVQENAKEDEMLARMEEQLQSLIEQGQAALTSRAVDMEAIGVSEMAMRKSFVSGGGGNTSRPDV